MARAISVEDAKKIASEEKGYVRALCWDAKRKKQIYDYVPKWRLQELIEAGYVLALAD